MQPMGIGILLAACFAFGFGFIAELRLVLADDPDPVTHEVFPFDKATIKSWQEAGAALRWFHTDLTGQIDFSTTKSSDFDLPGFVFGPQDESVDFALLAKPSKRFALFIAGNWLTFEQVCKLGRFEQIRALEMWSPDAPAEVLDGLAKCKTLRTLCLYSKKLNARSLSNIARLRQLNSLHLDGAKLDRYGLAALSSSTSLYRLTLEGNQLRGDALQILASSRRLRYLDVSGVVGDDALLNVGELWLEWLNLSASNVTARGLERLGATAVIGGLDLSNSIHVDDEACTAIKGLNLRKLRMQSASLTDSHMRILWSMEDLRFLDCSSNQFITGYKLSDVPEPMALKSLSLRDTSFSSKYVRGSLLKLKSLNYLDLSNTPINDHAIKALGEMKQLRVLDIRNTRITSQGSLKLEFKLPDTKVISSHNE